MEPVDNGMLLLANEEFDKEPGGYQIESEDAEEEKLEEEPSPKEKASKKRKASTKLRSSKKKRKRSGVTDGVEDEVPTEDDDTKKDECFPTKLVSKKSKTNKEKSGESETIITKVKSSSKLKRKKKQGLGVVSGAEDEAMTQVRIELIDKFIPVVYTNSWFTFLIKFFRQIHPKPCILLHVTSIRWMTSIFLC